MKSLFKVASPALVVGLMLGLGLSATAQAAGPATPNKKVEWSFEGPFGKFDQAQLQRGFQVYKEVCAACHSLHLVAFRTLGDKGGPLFSEAEVKAIAAAYEVQDGPDQDGEMFARPARPSDKFPGPYANEQQGRAANNGAYPPDLSLIAKARADGPNYLYSLLTGYYEAPADVHLNPGMSYNPYFPGGQIAMPQPISDDQVTYADGTPATVDQMSKDLAAFLMWTAEPKLEERKSLGFSVMIFLAIMTVLFYFANKRVWAPVKRGEDI